MLRRHSIRSLRQAVIIMALIASAPACGFSAAAGEAEIPAFMDVIAGAANRRLSRQGIHCSARSLHVSVTFGRAGVTSTTRCLVTGCSLCVLKSAIPQRTFSSGM